MAPTKSAVEFEAIINADRQRRKYEALAEEIFNRGRRSSAPSALKSRKLGAGPSLASRVGIAKKTISASPKPSPKPAKAFGDVNAEWTHDLHALNNPTPSGSSQLPPRAPKAARLARANQLQRALNGSASSPALNSQFNVVAPPASSPGISIRGLAGPYVVMAKNFAQGTTAADIESAVTPVGGITLSCRVVAQRPQVIAEIIFESKEGADAVVETFNNQTADGHLLHVYHKVGNTPSVSHLPGTTSASQTHTSRPSVPLGPRGDVAANRSDSSRSDPRVRHGRKNNDGGEVVDGSYGFDDTMDVDNAHSDKGKPQGLYSDSLVGKRNSTRGGGSGRYRGRGHR
ncbi:hypothetical protein F5884DRAFT_768465 [Xylogone sp. PMI_703]|nr:hypothetical protein F5884DRAFT_768465 [Xylogone sp. PMI_703]